MITEVTDTSLDDAVEIMGGPGYACYKRSDGTTIEHFYGGHTQIIQPDGTRINKWASGDEYTYFANGTGRHKKPNGDIVPFGHKDGRLQLVPVK